MTAAAPTDADLIAAHAAGDPDAFSEIVRRHRDRMWAVALRTMRDQEEAADALQDAFISAFRAAAKFRAESQVSTWLHRIVVNACLDRIRKRQSRPTVPLPETDEYREPAAPGDSMAQRETSILISSALQELPEDQRAPIVLVDVEGYSVSETAQLLGIAEGTVKSRCARGRAKLAKVLGHLRNPDANANVPPQDSTRGSGATAPGRTRGSHSRSPRQREGR
ncbi:MAG: RNA polymerase sigma factor SigM [Actinophytocola sp.]|nr:RNA polymerase sigma factor SigM [Actinophytocola sp.]